MSSVASSKGVAPGKGGPKGKTNKSDSKPDKNDLNSKIQIKPTAEQMQIAKIMDSHRSEEPEVQKKIKQVMEITRTSEDEASMALHSRDYDVEQAITLLTEGGSLQSEWAQAGKKKKTKTSGSKIENAKESIVRPGGKEGAGGGGDRGSRDKREKRDSETQEDFIVSGSGENRRGGGGGDRGRGARGRGSSRGAPGPGSIGRGGGGSRYDKENSENNGGGYAGRVSNGPGGLRGSRGGLRGGPPRTFTRSRGGGRDGDGGGSGGEASTFGNTSTIDVWDPNSQGGGGTKQPLKVEKWDDGEFPQTDDWDNNEYTGSLAHSKVFTPSSTSVPKSAANGPSAPGGGVGGGGGETNHRGSGGPEVRAPSESTNNNKISSGTGADPSLIATGPLDLNMLLQQQPQKVNNSSANQSAGQTILATLHQSSFANQEAMGGGLPQRHKVQKPRIPATKIPSSAVEMPNVSSMASLDVQFGGLEFGNDSGNSVVFGSSIGGGGLGVGGKPGDLGGLYGGPGQSGGGVSDGRSFSSKDGGGHGGSSSFQSQNQSQMGDIGKGGGHSSTTSNLPSSVVDPHSHLPSSLQGPPPGGKGPSGQSGQAYGSAFVAYGRQPPSGLGPAPGFPPQAGGGGSGGGGSSSSYNNPSVNTYGGGGGSGYLSSSSYGGVVTGQSNTNTYGGPPPPTAYGQHASANSNQYGSYQPKGGMGQNKGDSVSTDGSTVPSSSSQLSSNSLSSVPVIASSSSTKLTALNVSTSVPSTGSSGGGKMQGIGSGNVGVSSGQGMPQQGQQQQQQMMMPTQYILNQSGLPAYFSLQPSFYGMDDGSLQFLPRLPPHAIPGYAPYDSTYGQTSSGGTGRNDSGALGGFSSGQDSRFPRSDSSTASPVPSNITGGGGGSAMYNPTAAMPAYYYTMNNMVHSTFPPYGPPPPHMYAPTSAMGGSTPSGGGGGGGVGGGVHGTQNHQYGKGTMYGSTTYGYDATGQVGSGTDFSSPPSVNSQQSTEMNSSMYKGHMNKAPYDNKSYGGSSGGGPYSSMSGNPLNNTGIQPYTQLYLQPVQTLAPMPQPQPPQPQDGQGGRGGGGGGGPKGNNKQYGGGGSGSGGPPYWNN